MADAEDQRRLVAKQRRLAAEQHIPDYKVISLLGRGTYAHVWKCVPRMELEGSTRFVAVKQIDKAMTTLEWVLSEIQCMHKLHERCTHFVELIGHRWEKNHDYAYLIMEYCDGGDLETYLRRNGRLSERAIQALFRQIGESMRVMKEEGIIHRDIKPNNILLRNNDPSSLDVDPMSCQVKLADFGTAKMADKAASPNYGTTDYWAPEVMETLVYQRTGSRPNKTWSWRTLLPNAEPTYNAQCDMFSLGTVLYQCLTRRLPFKRATNIFGQDTGSISSMASDQAYEKPKHCSKELGDLIERLLVANASRRLRAEDFLGHPFFSKTLSTRPLTPENGRYTVAVIGAPGAGKSALCQQFVKGDFCGQPSDAPVCRPLGGPLCLTKELSTAEFTIRMRTTEPSTSDLFADRTATLRPPWACDAVVIVYDVADKRSFKQVRGLWNCIYVSAPEHLIRDASMKMRQDPAREGCVIVIVGTKTDLASSRLVTREEAESVARELGALYGETSAKTGDGVQELFMEIGNCFVNDSGPTRLQIRL